MKTVHLAQIKDCRGRLKQVDASITNAFSRPGPVVLERYDLTKKDLDRMKTNCCKMSNEGFSDLIKCMDDAESDQGFNDCLELIQ